MSDLKTPAQMSEHWGKIADLDKQIAREYDEGYDVDVHLEERRRLQEQWKKSLGPQKT